MYICNYCNRVLKEEYEKCPGCGASSFKTKAFLGDVIIKEPPKGGYKVNLENYQKTLKTGRIFKIIGLVAAIVPLLFAIPFMIIGFSDLLIMFPFESLIGVVFFCIGFNTTRKTKKAMKKATKLAKHGVLVKGIPYKEVNTGAMAMGKWYKCIEVKYKNASGVEIPLYSETKYNADIKNPETVDLLIDPDDYSNYFIDYEIY